MADQTDETPAPPTSAPPTKPVEDDQVETTIADPDNAPEQDIESPPPQEERDNLQSVALGPDSPDQDKDTAAAGENPFKTPKPEGEDGGADIPAAVVSPNYEGSGVPNQSETEEYEKQVIGCLVALVVTTCITMAQAASLCTTEGCDRERGFAVAAGCIPLIFTLIMLVLLKFKEPIFTKIVPYFSLFMVLWAGVSVAVCTFGAPFEATGNGYFAIWGTMIISIYFAQISVEKFKAILGRAVSTALAGNMKKRVLMMVLLFSVVVAFATVIQMGKGGSPGDTVTDKSSQQEEWVFSCGVVSAALIGIYQLIKINKKRCIKLTNVHLKFFSYFLSVWWLFGVGVATFNSPFVSTGNGYFTTWGAFLSSCYLAYLTTVATPEELARQDSNVVTP